MGNGHSNDSVTNLYLKNELISKLGTVLTSVSLVDGSRPLVRLKECTLKSESVKGGAKLTINCPLDDGMLVLTCKRHGTREQSRYCDWEVVSDVDYCFELMGKLRWGVTHN